MNKKSNCSLTTTDHEQLRLLSTRFELASQIIGHEPSIYFEFSISPEPDTDITTPLMDHRQGIFNAIASGKPKKV